MSCIALALCVGCAASHERCETSEHRRDERRIHARHPVNVALGQNADENALAEQFAARSSWPFRYDGLVVEDYESATDYQYDAQRFNDRDGGRFWRAADSIRVRTRLR